MVYIYIRIGKVRPQVEKEMAARRAAKLAEAGGSLPYSQNQPALDGGKKKKKFGLFRFGKKGAKAKTAGDPGYGMEAGADSLVANAQKPGYGQVVGADSSSTVDLHGPGRDDKRLGPPVYADPYNRSDEGFDYVGGGSTESLGGYPNRLPYHRNEKSRYDDGAYPGFQSSHLAEAIPAPLPQIRVPPPTSGPQSGSSGGGAGGAIDYRPSHDAALDKADEDDFYRPRSGSFTGVAAALGEQQTYRYQPDGQPRWAPVERR